MPIRRSRSFWFKISSRISLKKTPISRQYLAKISNLRKWPKISPRSRFKKMKIKRGKNGKTRVFSIYYLKMTNIEWFGSFKHEMCVN